METSKDEVVGLVCVKVKVKVKAKAKVELSGISLIRVEKVSLLAIIFLGECG